MGFRRTLNWPLMMPKALMSRTAIRHTAVLFLVLSFIFLRWVDMRGNIYRSVALQSWHSWEYLWWKDTRGKWCRWIYFLASLFWRFVPSWNIFRKLNVYTANWVSITKHKTGRKKMINYSFLKPKITGLVLESDMHTDYKAIKNPI